MTEVLRSRRAPAVTEPDAAGLEVKLRHANAIAAAKQALPQSYANNPGAILLAQEWAAARNVDLLTTIQSVSFISGRPVIDATMQRALAMRAGYEIAIEVGEDAATCTLSKDGKEVGSSEYTMQDAQVAGLTSKDNWKKNPKAMLVARATAQTMRWHAPDVMVGVFTEDEIDDPVDVLTPEPEPPKDDVVEAELVPADPPCSDETFAQLVALGASLEKETADDLKAWLDTKGWSLKKGDLTEPQAREVQSWVERRTR